MRRHDKLQRGGITGALLLFIAVATAVGYWLWNDYQRFLATPLEVPVGGMNYHIEPGTPLVAVARDLTKKEILRQPYYFRLLARQHNVSNQIKAGEYFIVRGTTPVNLLDQLVKGKVIEYSLTLIEGWTFEQILDAVRAHPMILKTLPESMSTEQLMETLGFGRLHPEGLFFPDTYHFQRGTTDVKFLQRAYHTMKKVLMEEWGKRNSDLPLKTPYQALILASIVEKETAVASERSQVAGVFLRRLQKGMLLQTDPTVIYGLGEAFDGNLRETDLVTDTPYNTYTRPGLPPTPIAMPGRAAIHAVMHPAGGKALYFVATGEGGHHFSNSLKEHNRAVMKYQVLKSDRGTQ